MSERTAAGVERELVLLAHVRDRLRASEGTDFRIPTTTVDRILEELNSLERSPHKRNRLPPVRTDGGGLASEVPGPRGCSGLYEVDLRAHPAGDPRQRSRSGFSVPSSRVSAGRRAGVVQ